MGKYEEEVRQKLGGEVVDWILDDVASDTITGEDMKNIAFSFGKKIGGDHMRRTRKKEPGESEMQQIFEDWWHQGDLQDLSTEVALKTLEKMFNKRTFDLKPLAKKIGNRMERLASQMVVENLHENPNKTLLIIGKTGSGKSSLCNRIAGEQANSNMFKVSSGPRSCGQSNDTRFTTMAKVQFMGDVQRAISLVDTNGFDDAEDSDNANITQHLVEELRGKSKFVNLIGLAVNGQSPRLDASLVTTIRTLEEMFGKPLWDHLVCVFTRLSMDQKQTRKRRTHNGNTDKGLGEEYVREIKKHFPECTSLPVLFLDACFDEEDEQENKHFNESIEKLYEKLESSKNLPTSSIVEDVSTENAKLKAALVEKETALVEKEQEILEIKSHNKKLEADKQKSEEGSLLEPDTLLIFEDFLAEKNCNTDHFKGRKLKQLSGDLSSNVTTLLGGSERDNIIFWRQTKYEDCSGHVFFKLSFDRSVVNCVMLALLSWHTMIKNTLRLSSQTLESLETSICGDVLEDLKELLRLLNSSVSGKPKIFMEALNREPAVRFYVKHGFVPDNHNRIPDDNSTIPMTLEVHPHENAKHLDYEGMNQNGNKYLTYSDQSYSYMNMTHTSEGKVLESVYHSASQESPSQFGSIPMKKRKPFQEESDIKKKKTKTFAK